MRKIRLNNLVYSYHSCSFRCDAIPLTGVLSVDFSDGRERTKVYANRRDGRPEGFTSGKYIVEQPKLKMLKDHTGVFEKYLTAKGLGSPGDATFLLTITTLEPAPGSIPSITTLEGCMIAHRSTSIAEGTEATATEYTLDCEEITQDGFSLASLVREFLP